jgi:hypothetical protein
VDSSLTLKTRVGVSYLPLSIALLFAFILKSGSLTQVNLDQLSTRLESSELICQYVPPPTGDAPEGEGSGSRT